MTTTTPSLNEHLADAQRAEASARSEVTRLEAELATALGAEDYAAADRLQRELVPARTALAGASAASASLNAAAADIERQRASDQTALAEARRNTELRAALTDAIETQKRLLTDSRARRADIRQALNATRQAIAAAIAAEQAEVAARAEVERIRVELGEAQPGRYRGGVETTRTEGDVSGGDALLTALWRDRR